MDRYARDTTQRTLTPQDDQPTAELRPESIDYDAETVELPAPSVEPRVTVERPAADEPTQVSVTVQVHRSRDAKGSAQPGVIVEGPIRVERVAREEPPAAQAAAAEPAAGAATRTAAPRKAVPPTDGPAFRVGATIRERYVLEEQIGSGGTSRVFRARDLRRDPMFDRDGYVALKVMRPSLEGRRDIVERLRREFHQTQSLAHPNIVRMLDIDCENGAWFITMELLDGESLGTVLACLHPQVLPPHEAMAILRGCGEALAFAHERGVLHCDFKPGNVFVTRSEEVRVLDFGVAAPGGAGEPGVEPARATAATPCYASPEILEGRPPEERDDVFSFACVAYEVLTGRHPFDRRSTLEARDDDMRVVRLPGLTRRQHRALERALSWSRRERPASIRQLIVELELTTPPRKPSSLGWLKGLAALAAGAVIAAVFYNLYESRDDRAAQGQQQQQARESAQGGEQVEWAAASPVERRERAAQLAGAPATTDGADAVGSAGQARTVAPDAASREGSVPSEESPVRSFPMQAAPAADTSAQRPQRRAAVPNRVSFEQARIVASEGAVSAVLRIRRLDDLSGRVRIQWRAIPGTAQPGSDYSMDGIGTIEIPSGQDVRVVYIPILNDEEPESNESFDVEIFDIAGPGSLEPITRATVTILDND